MTIRKGSDYGVVQPLPEGAAVARSDAELRELVLASRGPEHDRVTIGLVGGDLCKTLGGAGDIERLSGPDALTVPIDLAIASIDGVDVPFVSHLVVGKLFRRNFAVVMNAQWRGEQDLGPRSHPGDGFVDITTGSLQWRQRRVARARLVTGTHLPHPSLNYRRVRSETIAFDRSMPMCLDGEIKVKGRTLALRVEPDSFHVVV
jgi:hypothetical protein